MTTTAAMKSTTSTMMPKITSTLIALVVTMTMITEMVQVRIKIVVMAMVNVVAAINHDHGVDSCYGLVMVMVTTGVAVVLMELRLLPIMKRMKFAEQHDDLIKNRRSSRRSREVMNVPPLLVMLTRKIM